MEDKKQAGLVKVSIIGIEEFNEIQSDFMPKANLRDYTRSLFGNYKPILTITPKSKRWLKHSNSKIKSKR
jgi:hypothetical protein